MKLTNMLSNKGNRIANQFIITDDSGNTYFQSYNSIIAKQGTTGQTWLDCNTWDYSTTTAKYRNIFLGETLKETKAKIKSGVYILIDLNS
jgi:hypothetical protein